MILQEVKICSRCEQTKSVSDFHKNCKSKDGLHLYCKECRAKIQKQYRQKNKEKLNERDRTYYYENREKMKGYHRQYSKENREVMNKSTNEFYRKHPEKLKAKNILNQAIQKGEIARPIECSCCGCISPGGIEGHHPDYSKPLDVLWLCRGCHIDLHNKIR